MKQLISLFFTCLLLLPAADCFSQQDLTLYNLTTIPQQGYANPALTHNSKFYIGLPVISSIYLNFNHNGFVFTDLVKKRSNGSVYLDADNVIDNKLRKLNYFSVAAQVDWISAGWKANKNHFFFNITEKVFMRFSYPKDLIKLFVQGNGVFVDEDQAADFSGIGLKAILYREYAFGMARDINEQFTIGGKLKYLYGMQNISTKKSDLSLYTDTTTYELTGKSDMLLNTSFDTAGNFLSGNKNTGFGIDLGANYKLNDKFSFSASLIDLGYIKWKNNAKNYTTDNAEFVYNGIDLNVFTDTTADPFQALEDSLISAYEPIETSLPYRDGLITRVYLGGTYSLNEKNNFGLLLHAEFFKKAIYPSLTLSFNNRVGEWLGTSISYSILNRSYNNIGFGFSVNLGPIQLYMVSDNLLPLFNLAELTTTDSAGTTSTLMILPRKAKNAHIRFGLNLTFGRKEKDRDKDGVIDKEDECPDIPGPVELNGCPDRDGDGIIDMYDKCPDDPGLAEFQGCPDRDGDKVIDKDDKCPDVPGPVENKGCPVKLYLVDQSDDTLMTALINDDGFFVFEKLPEQQVYLFLLDAEDKDLIDEVQILRTNKEGDEEIITAVKTEEGYFRFESLQPHVMKLYLIDQNGDTLRFATLNDDGFFVFERLPLDRNYMFLLDTKDTELMDEILILIIDENGEEIIITATRDSDNLFRYEYLPQFEVTGLDLEEEEDIVILEEEEEEIVNTAFENLEFNFGSDVISYESYSSLDELSQLLIKKPEWDIKLSGHTDNIGSTKANLMLSKKRAEAVKKFLVKRGVSSKRVFVRYYGETYTIADNSTEEGRRKNRRVEMLILQNTSGALNIVFKVQILSSKKSISLTPANFKGVENVKEYLDGGLYKYTVGETPDIEVANALQAEVRKKGYKEAFIVAFKNRVRISVNQALELLK